MEKGQDFRAFTLTCARAFVACVMQRDEPVAAPPEKQAPSNYSATRMAETMTELARLNDMTSDERFAFGQDRKTKALTSAAEHLQREKEQNQRIEEMMEQVVAWKPPSTDHSGLKDFMIEQLTISRHDLKYANQSLTEATKKSGRDYFDEAFVQAQHGIEYHRKEVSKEHERTEGRNRWIEQLYTSLDGDSGR
ncbi:MAG: hypothetical protein A3E01_08125 [Gammaproteobacteria bacterium RIFCSPHIGHO2_12_FULL_63_22]|nr:MAG: hypothetical protein A3E01_08125 [Gammaproteobacteria bacterium RIFCSPHIGHO2_12_FULL_63_22]